MSERKLDPPRRPASRKVEENDNVIKASNPSLSKWFTTGAIDIPFFAITIALLTIGLIMLFSASYPYALQKFGDSYYYFKRQLIFAIVGVVVMLIVSKLNYRKLILINYPLLAFTLLCLVVVLKWHTNVGDFKRWIPLGPFTFQPSDIAKFSIIVTLAAYIAKNYKDMKRLKTGIVIPLAIVFVFCGLIYLEHSLSCTLLVGAIGVAIMFAGGSDWRLYAIGIGLVVAAVALVIINPDLLMNYAGERITAWLDKSYEPTGARWQTNNSLYAIGSGGWMGVGLGNSKQKYLYVSEPQNDFIFAIVCEELGLIGAAIIIVLFGILFARGVWIAMRCPDRFGALVVIGVIAQLAVQTILNIMVVTDTIPNTGISLPFFSYGGTAILMQLFEMGVVLAISRKTNQRKV